MRKITILILAFLGCIPGVIGQQNTKEAMEVRIDPEEVFVHYNSSFLMPGETLYFKFYSRNSRTKQLSTLSKVGYVELVDAEKNIVFKHKIALQEGHGQGDFFIPSSILSGNYKVIGYTRSMIGGAEERFFEGDLSIVNPFLNEQQDLFSSDSSTEDDALVKYTVALAPQNTPLAAGNLEIQLSTRIYEKRGKVNFVINNTGRNPASAGAFSISVRKRDILELLPMHTAQNFPAV
ncbi:MAG TPA: hypothetical protein VK916_01435, partial [Gillisia sp.]|nr:hypothetical protein [Gillisia sp.]